METIQIINGYNEAAKVVELAKREASKDAQAIYNKVWNISQYINREIERLLQSYAE